jgi:hypothetical protein
MRSPSLLEEAMPFIVVGVGLFIYLAPVIWVLLSGRSRASCGLAGYAWREGWHLIEIAV